RSTKLITKAAMVTTLGQSRVNPSLYFSPIAQAISNRPAKKSNNQDMVTTSSCRGRPQKKQNARGRPRAKNCLTGRNLRQADIKNPAQGRVFTKANLTESESIT